MTEPGQRAPIVMVCQRIRAGWLPHKMGHGWWYGRPRAGGFDYWRMGVTPSMSVVEQMPDDERDAWIGTLHEHAPENPNYVPPPSPHRQTGVA